MTRKTVTTVTITCDRCGENAEDPECKGVAVAMMNARVGVFNMMGIREDLYPNQLDLCGKCTKDLVSFMQNEPPKHEGSDVCGVCAQRIGVVFEPHMCGPVKCGGSGMKPLATYDHELVKLHNDRRTT